MKKVGAWMHFPLVDVDAKMAHGWPLPSAASTAGALLWGSIGHRVEREAGRFIPATLLRRPGRSSIMEELRRNRWPP